MPRTAETEFRRIYELHYDAVARFCLRRLTPGEAHDAVSEVFVTAWRRSSDIPQGSEALPWLYAIAHNIVRNSWRSRRRRVRLVSRLSLEPEYPAPGPEVFVVRREEDRCVAEAIATLSETDQEVIRLRAYEDLTIHEIAVVVGCTDAAAGKRLQRALRRLREVLEFTRPASPAGHPRAIPEGGER